MSATEHSLVPRVAIVGIGGYGQTHLQIIKEFQASGRCRLVSVVAPVDTRAESLATLPPEGAKVYTRFESWLEHERGSFDLCCLPTPIHLHASMALSALAAGGSVLLEKPLAASRDELFALISAEPMPSRFLAIGFQDLYLHELRTLKADLVSGRYGRLQQIKFLGLWPRGENYYRRNSWAGKLAHGREAILDSPLNNAFAHFIMMALFLAGERAQESAVPVNGKAELYRAKPIEGFDTAVVRLKTRSGPQIFCACTHSGVADETPRLVIETDTGQIEWRVWHDLCFTPKRGKATLRPMPDMEQTRRRQFDHILRRTQGDATALTCSARLAAAHAACILDLHANVEIHDVKPIFLRQVTYADGNTITIESVDNVMRRAFAQGLFPSDLGLDWARPSTYFENAITRQLSEHRFHRDQGSR